MSNRQRQDLSWLPGNQHNDGMTGKPNGLGQIIDDNSDDMLIIALININGVYQYQYL